MTAGPVYSVAVPVVRLADGGRRAGRVLGGSRGTRYVVFGRTVVAITLPGVPRMPTAVVMCTANPFPDPGSRAELRPGRLLAGDLEITWDPVSPPTWDPRIPSVQFVDPMAVGRRGEAILARLGPTSFRSSPDSLSGALSAVGPDIGLRRGFDLLLRSLEEGSPTRARASAEALVGLGGGATPEGDDWLAGAACAVHVLRPAWAPRWFEAILPADLEARTTALSATLLRLAAEGAAMEPVRPLLDFGTEAAGEVGVPALLEVGRSTGRAYASSIGEVLRLLGGTNDAIHQRRREGPRRHPAPGPRYALRR